MSATTGSIGSPTRFRSLFCALESAFGTSALTPGNSNRVPAIEPSFSPTMEYLERPVQLDVLGEAPGLVGGKGGELTFKIPLSGLGTANGSGAGAAADVGEPLASLLLASCLKRLRQQGKATASDQTESATALKLASGAGSSGKFGVGNSGGAPFAAVAGAAGIAPFVVRAIPASASGDEQTLAPPLSVAGGARNLDESEDVYGADVYYPDQSIGADAAGEPYYCSFVAGGAGFSYTFTGCRGTLVRISGDAGKPVLLEFKFMVSGWTRTASSATAGETFTNIHPQITALGSPFFWKAAATGSTPISGFSFETGHELAAVMSTEADQGHAGFQPTALKPKLTVKPYLASGWASDFAAETSDLALLQLGKVPGRAAALLLPYAMITKFPGEADVGGVVGHDVELTGFNSISGGPLAPFYLAFY